MDSIRFRSCSRENCSLRTLNLVSTSIMAQRYLDIRARIGAIFSRKDFIRSPSNISEKLRLHHLMLHHHL